MDLNLANAEIAVRRKLLEDVSPLQIVAPTQIKDHHQTNPDNDQKASGVKSPDSLTKAETKQVLERFQPLAPLLKAALAGAHSLRQGFQNLKNLTRDSTETPVAVNPPPSEGHAPQGPHPHSGSQAIHPPQPGQPIPPVRPEGKNLLQASPANHPEQPAKPHSPKTAQAQAGVRLGQPGKPENLPAGGHTQPPPPFGIKETEVTQNHPTLKVRMVRPPQPGQPIPPVEPEWAKHLQASQVNRPESPASTQKSKTPINTQVRATENLGQPAKPENLPAGGPVQPPQTVGIKVPGAAQNPPVPNVQAIRPIQPGLAIPSVRLEGESHPQAPQVNQTENQTNTHTPKTPVITQTKVTENLGQSAKSENLPAGGPVLTPLTVGTKAPEATENQPLPNVQAIRPTQPGQPIPSVKPEGENNSQLSQVNHPEQPVNNQQAKTPTTTQTKTTENIGQPSKAENLPAGGPAQIPLVVGIKAPGVAQTQPALNVQAVRPPQPGQPVPPTRPGENGSQASPIKQAEKPANPLRSKTPVTTQTQATENLGRPAKSENLPAGGPVQPPQTVATKEPEAPQNQPVPNVQAIHPTQPSRSVPPARPEGENHPPVARIDRPEQPVTTQQPKTPLITQTQTTQNLGQPAKPENLPAGGSGQTSPTVGVKTPAVTQNHPTFNVQAVPIPKTGQTVPPTHQISEAHPPLVQAGNREPAAVPGQSEIGRNVQAPVSTTVQQPANHLNVPAGGNPQAPVAVTPRVPQTLKTDVGKTAQAIPPVVANQPVHPAKVEGENPLPVKQGREQQPAVLSAGKLTPHAGPAVERVVPLPKVLMPEPPISAVPGSQAPISSVSQSQIEGTRPIVIPSDAPAGGVLLAPGLSKEQAIQIFQRNLREASSRTTFEEAQKTTELLQQHPLVNLQPLVSTSPQTIREKLGSTDETVTQLAGPSPNNPILRTEIVARTPVRGDNRLSTEPIGKAESEEVGPQNGSRLPIRPPAHAVPPLLNVNSQLRPPLPTIARSRLVAVTAVNLLDLSL